MGDKKLSDEELERQARKDLEMEDSFEYLGDHVEATKNMKTLPYPKSMFPGFKYADGSEPRWAPEQSDPGLPKDGDDDEEKSR